MVSILLSGAGGKMGQVITRSVVSAATAALLPASISIRLTAAIRFSPLLTSVMFPAMSSSTSPIRRSPCRCLRMQSKTISLQ